MTWSIPAGAGGSVSAGGSATANAVGDWTVTGDLGGTAGTATLTVNHASAASVAISPSTTSITAGGSQAFTATASDTYSNTWDTTSTVTWSIEVGASGSVSAGGSATAEVVGDWTVTGDLGGLSDTATLTVNHASATSVAISPNTASIMEGETQAFTATASDAYGNTWAVTSTVTWSIPAGASGSVSADGSATADKEGDWTVTGDLGGTAGTATLTVTEDDSDDDNPLLILDHFDIEFITGPQIAGDSFRIIITATDSNGERVYLYTGGVTLSCSAGPISPASATGGFSNGYWTGSVTVTKAGSGVSITATKDAVTGKSNTFTVIPAEIVDVVISPASSSLIAGTSTTFTAIATDEYGNTWDVTSSTSWGTSSGAEGSWNDNVYTSATAGSWTITGLIDSNDYSADLTVTHAPPVSISINPNTVPITAGETEEYTATAVDIYGNTWDVTSTVNWSIETSSSGSVSTDGSATATTSGDWTITASFDGATSGTAQLQVTHADAESVHIVSTPITTDEEETMKLNAKARDKHENTWDVTPIVTWNIPAGAEGSIQSDGSVTLAIVGNWTITATLGEITSEPTTVNVRERDFTNQNQTEIQNLLTVNMMGSTSTGTVDGITGEVEDSIDFSSENGLVQLIVDEGVLAIGPDGYRITEITIDEVEEALLFPEEGTTGLGSAVDLGPSGALFNPPLVLNLGYSIEDLSLGTNENELYIAYWDGTEWIAVASTVNPETNIVTASLSHFTVYTIIMEAPTDDILGYSKPSINPVLIITLAAGLILFLLAYRKVIFVTSPRTVSTGEVSDKVTIQVLNVLGKPNSVLSDTIIEVTSDSPTARLSMSPTGLFEKSTIQITVSKGTNSTTFYFKDEVAGEPIIKASRGPRLVWQGATQQEVVKET